MDCEQHITRSIRRDALRVAAVLGVNRLSAWTENQSQELFQTEPEKEENTMLHLVHRFSIVYVE